MDILELCAQLSPIPYLSPAVSILQQVLKTIDDVKVCRLQLRDLAQYMATILSFLNKQHAKAPVLMDSTRNNLEGLYNVYREISEFIKQKARHNFFKMIIMKDDIQTTIGTYHTQLSRLLKLFKLDLQINMQVLAQQQNSAREADHRELNTHIRLMGSNQNALKDLIKQEAPAALAAVLQKKITTEQGIDAEERRFLTQSLDIVKKQTGGRSVHLEPWTISALEIDYETDPLASGGFGKVHRGTWHHTQVAVKVIKNAEGNIPEESNVASEANIWHKMRHPNILQFLGVNILDDTPFIVMPFMEKGNARKFLDKSPNHSRLKIIYEASLGIEYLHSRNIVHGDLKAANILISDAERAVLCDFGLSRIKADVDSKSKYAATKTFNGSLHWMPPERLRGGLLRKPCDIYSFAMTMYEIYVNDVPMSGLSDITQFTNLVADRKIRPDRPTPEEAPHLTDGVWNLMVECWNDDALKRPTAHALCGKLQALMKNAPAPELPKPVKHNTAQADLASARSTEQIWVNSPAPPAPQQRAQTDPLPPVYTSQPQQYQQPAHANGHPPPPPPPPPLTSNLMGLHQVSAEPELMGAQDYGYDYQQRAGYPHTQGASPAPAGPPLYGYGPYGAGNQYQNQNQYYGAPQPPPMNYGYNYNAGPPPFQQAPLGAVNELAMKFPEPQFTAFAPYPRY